MNTEKTLLNICKLSYIGLNGRDYDPFFNVKKSQEKAKNSKKRIQN